MKVVIGADHGGWKLKEEIVLYLEKSGHMVTDVGTHSTVSVDYPDICKIACDTYSNSDIDYIILICGTGIGMSLCANKYVETIRCAVCNDEISARMSRMHNNANAIALGARIIDYETARKNIDIFFDTEFEGGRHTRRINKFSS